MYGARGPGLAAGIDILSPVSCFCLGFTPADHIRHVKKIDSQEISLTSALTQEADRRFSASQAEAGRAYVGPAALASGNTSPASNVSMEGYGRSYSLTPLLSLYINS